MSILKYGSTGPEVKKLQARLGVTQDGIWGKQTQAAYLASQRAQGQQQTGTYRTRVVPLTATSGPQMTVSAPRSAAVAALSPQEVANYQLQRDRANEMHSATMDRLNFQRSNLVSDRTLSTHQFETEATQARERLLAQMAARGIAGSGIQAQGRDAQERNILVSRQRGDQQYQNAMQEVRLTEAEAQRALSLLLSQILGQEQSALANRRAQLQGAF